MIIPKIELVGGVKIPCLGYGPGGFRFPSTNNRFPCINGLCDYFGRKTYTKHYIDGVSHAISLGYTLIDSSDTYNNFPQIKKAWEKAGVSREDLFITSRVDNRAQVKGNIRDNFFSTLKKLDTDYLDLYQFHWPVKDYYVNTWKELIKLKEEGYIRVIGVANCHQHHIECLFDATGVMPEIDQFEVHPLFSQKSLVSFCKANDIQVQAYTPIARFDDRLIRLPKLNEIAANHKKNKVQVILRWHIQNGLIPIIKSFNKNNQRENLNIFDFELSMDEMKQIDGFNINSRLRYDPDNCDFSIL
ncbi:aldo/keto reductase [Prevotella sp. E9-3]|uniref:aldo/keto reductase n=1 Tax=Prevotella sp. E9-3 TaxID=2913621 RepID=UPI001EDBB3C7|nr:aldo/keto reductase [Prevotella sp. E9-3]UKK47609.1 aldo/keto reductase [Prevotella sp. E9-3]